MTNRSNEPDDCGLLAFWIVLLIGVAGVITLKLILP